ncbi:MAG: iron-containing alcohol dehydrogenase, partial [bacterium]|nr:iron-containing alcohol dehydrogenase [bacterium]
ELSLSLPPAVTAASGMDALTQLIEAFVSPHATPITDIFCREGITRAATALPRAFSHPDDLAARADMAFAALLSGLALANAKLGAVHALASPLGGLLRAPHGALCARLLPFVSSTNITLLRATNHHSHLTSLSRYAEIARLANAGSSPEDAAAWLAQLSELLLIPPLSAHGLSPNHFPEIIRHALAASSMKGNPVPLTADHLHIVLSRAL